MCVYAYIYKDTHIFFLPNYLIVIYFVSFTLKYISLQNMAFFYRVTI